MRVSQLIGLCWRKWKQPFIILLAKVGHITSWLLLPDGPGSSRSSRRCWWSGSGNQLCTGLCVLFLLYNSGSSYLLNLVYLGCPTVEKEYWKHVTIHTVRSCIYGRCYEHALLTIITCGRNRQNATVWFSLSCTVQECGICCEQLQRTVKEWYKSHTQSLVLRMEECTYVQLCSLGIFTWWTWISGVTTQMFISTGRRKESFTKLSVLCGSIWL